MPTTAATPSTTSSARTAPGRSATCSRSQAAGSITQVFAVTSVDDEKKGEKLAVLHTLPEEDIPGIVEKLGTMGLPNLFIPRLDQFVKVDVLPLLGTGKLDLCQVKRVAKEALVSSK